MCLFFGKKKKEVEVARKNLETMWADIPTNFSNEVSIRIRRLKTKLDKYLSSDSVSSADKCRVANEVTQKLAGILAPAKRAGRPVSEPAFNNFISAVENIIDPATVDMGAFGDILQAVRNGTYNNLLTTEEMRNNVLDGLSLCFSNMDDSAIDNAQKEKIGRALENLRTTLFAGTSYSDVSAALDRVIYELNSQIATRNNGSIDGIYAEKIKGVTDFLNNAESISNKLKSERKVAIQLSNATQAAITDIGARAAEAKQANKTQEYNNLYQSFVNEKAKRDGYINKANLLNNRSIAIEELYRKLNYIIMAGVSLEDVEPALSNTTFGKLLNEDYEFVNQLLNRIIERIVKEAGNVKVGDVNYDGVNPTVVNGGVSIPDMPIDPEFEEMMNNHMKSKDLDLEIEIKNKAHNVKS